MRTEGSTKVHGARTAERARDFSDLAMVRPIRAPMSMASLKDADGINGKTEKCTKESGKME